MDPNLDGTLFYGDCLDILRNRDLKGDRYIKDESVDLIYLDPPFNSDRVYNVIFKEPNGHGAASQIKGFDDTWTWNDNVAKEYEEIKEQRGKVADTMVGLEKILGFSNMFAYLVMMASRLIEMRRVLKPTGTLYYHCDQTAGHYIKILLDAIFGTDKFRNEIVWCYTGPGNHPKDFGRKHDTIFRYVKGNSWTFNTSEIRLPYNEVTLKRRGYSETKKGGIKFKGKDIEEYAEGKIPEDWWTGISSGGQISRSELLGYPTQKPEALLERIIKASSNEGDIVLDPFSGCGTCTAVANRLHRKWIGIDITAIAITIMKNRLITAFPDVKFKVIGEPTTPEDARRLAESDDPEARYQFQLWALGLDNARPIGEVKKGADKGVDGKRYFDTPDGTQMIVYSVKSGGVNAKDVRDLGRVVDREKAAIGVLISMEPITKPMRVEASTMGYYRPSGLSEETYSKVQLYTIEDLMKGEKVKWPRYLKDVTFKEAPKAEKGSVKTEEPGLQKWS